MIYCFGSINLDIFYRVDHIPLPGETIAAQDRSIGLGGKGANQSVALAKAGVPVRHIGAVGSDGAELLRQISDFGVDISGIEKRDDPTGHAIISVGDDGENAITLFPGANTTQSEEWLAATLKSLGKNDTLILQNETNLVTFAAKFAKTRGATVIYSAAPFDLDEIQSILPFVDLLAVNEIEASQISKALSVAVSDIPVAKILVTQGANGAALYGNGDPIFVPSPKVEVVDTTGAGDTFLGYFVAALSEGKSDFEALDLAAHAAALKVTKKGTADAIPTRDEVRVFQR